MIHPSMKDAARSSMVAVLFAILLTGCGQEPAPKAGISFPSRSPKFLDVYETYGPLTVYPGELTAFSEENPGKTPWVGWWMPYVDPHITSGEQSLLKKYERVSRAMGIPSDAVAEEKAWARGKSDSDGRCYAWAMASIMEEDPELILNRRGLKSIRFKGEIFTGRDLQMLLTHTYGHMDNLMIFGEQYGLQGDDGKIGSNPDDIYPDQFHRFMQAEMFEKRRPFMIDREMEKEIWAIPVFNVSFSIRPDSKDPDHRLNVIAELHTAAPYETHDDDLRKWPTYYYTYDLIGNKRSDGGYDIVFGEWKWNPWNLGKHPDFVYAMLDDRNTRRSLNKEIRNDVVDAIMAAARGE